MQGQIVDADFERLSTVLRDFYQRSHRLIDKMMTEHGASFARARVLTHIARQGPTRSIDLAVSFGYAPRTVTEAIDGLERDGLVRRDPDPEDRRAKRISLTDAGSRAVEAAEASRLRYQESVFGVLDAQEHGIMIRVLDKLNDRLAELGA